MNLCGRCAGALTCSEEGRGGSAADVGEDEIDQAVKAIADNNKPFAAKGEGAEAKLGDRVTISFKGSIDGELFEGGSGEDVPVVIG